jgi:hypothetical protein
VFVLAVYRDHQWVTASCLLVPAEAWSSASWGKFVLTRIFFLRAQRVL